MHSYKNTKKVFTVFFAFSLFTSLAFCKPPRVVIGFTIDQFAHHYLAKVEPHLSGGIKLLLKSGVVYNNAYIPHAQPSTATGHVTMSTGAYPCSHGIIGNGWLNENNKKIHYEKLNANREKQAIFSPTGVYEIGKGPHNIMVDGIADQFVLHSKPNHNYQFFGLSHKSRASIGLANKMGKAIWFDKTGRQFTSSKAYFEKLPAWLIKFNQEKMKPELPKNYVWNLFHKNNPLAYNFFEAKNYKLTGNDFSMIGTKASELMRKDNDDYGEAYIKTPHATQHILDLAKACFDEHITQNQSDRLFLWISLSSLDPLGHYYGPDSQETLDMIYHLDWQIQNFMKQIESTVDPKDVLYFLTADHGVMPLVEVLQKKGFTSARRVFQKDLVTKLNQHIFEKLDPYDRKDLDSLVVKYSSPQFYLNKKIWKSLSKEERKKITKTAKKFLTELPAFHTVWTYKELNKLTFAPNDINWRYKNQLYPGRNGYFICRPHPYCSMTKYKKGTGHRTPYEYDTHVPLMLYQKDAIEEKRIEQKVELTQLANTLAKICEIAKPSASTAAVLPGV